MQYEFLKQFSKRMKHVGMYALLLQNSLAKQTWKQYGFMKTDEQINMIFAVMLYIMEQSLREESCTMDIAAVKGAKNILLGGEGIFNTVVRGPGKVILQTMPISNVAELLTPFFTDKK